MSTRPRKPLSSIAIFVIVLTAVAGRALATFSVVAIDRSTGEVGCAGASCINGVGKIGDTIQGIGAINTQALYDSRNQMNARLRMLAGDSPDQIIAWLHANDSQRNPESRQYGIVDLGNILGRSAAYSGTLTSDWKGARNGPDYSIQGNILLGPQVVDRMQAAFLANGKVSLAERLMRTLEAAAFVSADRRCWPYSSLSAFIRVERIGDQPATPYLKLQYGSNSEEPIRVLRRHFDEWKANLASRVDPYLTDVSVRPPVRLADGRAMGSLVVLPRNLEGTRLGGGLTIAATHSGGGTLGDFTEIQPGIYAAEITAPTVEGLDAFTVTVDDGSGSGAVTMARTGACRYVPPPSGGG